MNKTIQKFKSGNLRSRIGQEVTDKKDLKKLRRKGQIDALKRSGKVK